MLPTAKHSIEGVQCEVYDSGPGRNCGILEGYRWHGFAGTWQTPVLGELAQLTATPRGLRTGLNRMNPRPLPRSFTDRISKYADWGHKRGVLKLYRASENLAAAFPEFAGKPFSDERPVCVIWGEADPFVGVQYAENQAAYFPGAEIHVLPGLGHWPFIDDREAVLQPLSAFLKRQFQRFAKRTT